DVHAGILAVQGSLLSDVTGHAGSIISGTGSIGDLTIHGGLAPGSSIGTLTVNGDFNMTATSVYAVDISADGTSDLVQVGGTARLDGTVRVIPLAGYRPGTPYTILTAANGLEGTEFNEAVWNEDYLFLLSPALSY